jgi:hypothetical protein
VWLAVMTAGWWSSLWALLVDDGRTEPAVEERVHARGAQGLLIAVRQRFGVHAGYSRLWNGRDDVL